MKLHSRKWIAGLIALITFLSARDFAYAQTLAFEEAAGFGRFASGARGNLGAATVYHVTNLNDSGAGSFRDAVSQGNRFIVFDVGGVINLNSAVSVDKSNLYIAGQTAPGGISFYGDKVSFSGANNLIARYMAVRLGTSQGREDASGLSRGSNMIFDHMSVTWGVDETFSMNPASGQTIDNITIQNSIIGQGLDVVGHSASGLMTIGEGNHFSVIQSLFTDSVTRNPKVRGENEFINNVVYGYETAGYIMGDTTATSHANAEGNYFIEGPVNGSNPFASGTSSFHIYGNDNWVDTNSNGLLDGSLITSYPGADVLATRINFPTIASMSAQEAVSFVLANSGVNITRDAVDTRILEELASFGTLGGVIVRDSQLFPGWGTDPAYLNPRARLIDSDNDGMPDNWESSRGLNPNNASDFKSLDRGYTRLEEYLNELGGYGSAISTIGGDWNNVATWSGSAPTFADSVVLTEGMTHSSGNAFARQLTLNGSSALSGGTLDVFDTLRIGSGEIGSLALQSSTLSAGRIVLGGKTHGSEGTLTLNSGATVQTGTIGSDGGLARLVMNGGTIRATGTPNITVGTTLSILGGAIDTNGYSGAISGKLSGVGALTKNGNGTLVVSGDNDFSGGMHVNGGALGLGHLRAAGTGTIHLNGATYLPTISNITNAIHIESTATITAGGLTVGGAITGSNGATLNINTASGGASNMSLGGELSGFAGTFNFSGSSGNVRINRSGSSQASFDLGNGTAQIRTAFGGDVHMGSLSGGSETALKGATNNASLTNYVVGAKNTSTSFSGTIGDGPFAGSTTGLTKVGQGTLTLSGANSYSGNTAVLNGTLIVNGHTGLGVTTVASTARLGGNGTITGGLEAFGEVTPGNSPGSLYIDLFVRFRNGSLLTMELADPVFYDRLVVNGALTIDDGASVQILAMGLIPHAGQSFDLFDWQTIVGEFSNIRLPALSNGLAFDTSNLYSTGTIRIVTSVPEPSSCLSLGLMASVLVVRRRSRAPKR